MLSKKLMSSKGSLDNMNLFQIITIMAFFMLAPVTLLFEGAPFLPARVAELVGCRLGALCLRGAYEGCWTEA